MTGGAARDALRFLVTGVLVAAIVVFDPRAGHAGGRPKYLLVVAGAAVAVPLLVAVAAAGGRPWRANPLRWPVAALVAWSGLSALASDHRDTAVFGFPGTYDGFLSIASFAVLFFAAAAGFTTRRHVHRALEVLWFGAGSTLLLFALGQLADRLVSPDTGWDWARPDVSPWTIGSTLGNPNHLGGLLVMLLPVAIVLAVLSRGRRRALVLAGIGLAVAVVAITASRGAWLAALVAAAVLGLMFRADLRPHRARALVLAGGAVAVVTLVLLALAPTGATKIRPGHLARTGPGTTFDLRREVWATSWHVATDHPVLGVGPDAFAEVFPDYRSERFILVFGAFTVANGAHNVFLNTLATTGAGGLLAFLAVLAAAARHLARRWRTASAVAADRVVVGGVAAALVAYLVQASLNVQSVPLGLTSWFLLGLAVRSEPCEEV